MCDISSVGEYVCKAENMVAMVRKSFTLTRKDVLEHARRNIEQYYIYQQALPLVSFCNKPPYCDIFLMTVILCLIYSLRPVL